MKHKTDYLKDGNHLELVTKYKYLGIFLDVNIDWNTHITNMAIKISKKAGSSKMGMTLFNYGQVQDAIQLHDLTVL